MTPRQQRRLLKRYENQIRLERNGAPIPPEIAAQMTKPKDQALYQCVVEHRDPESKEEGLLAVGPKGSKELCEAFLYAIIAGIASGKERYWTNPHVCAVI